MLAAAAPSGEDAESRFPEPPTPSFLFDLDGTLVDSAYQHVIAWQMALDEHGLPLALAGIHRRIGMSGGLLAEGVLRETGRRIAGDDVQALTSAHDKHFAGMVGSVHPLPGAAELLAELDEREVPWCIATSGTADGARSMLELIDLPRPIDDVPLVTSADVSRAKPDPHLFLAGAALLGSDPKDCIVVGDSIWDLLAARRAQALGVGLLSGGYSEDELVRAMAFRVYADPGDLHRHLDELGIGS